MKKFCFTAVIALLSLPAFAAELQEILLPPPDMQGGKPLMQCFAERRSLRRFDTAKLPDQIVSEILFSADGVTRKDGRKTVPTARNRQNQRVYVFTSDGVYLYKPAKHALAPVCPGDHRKICGTQPFHAQAPLVLVFVSDMSAVGNTPELQALYAGNHSGSASQNVYLYAASQNLSTVICGLLDRQLISNTLNLPKTDKVIFSQPIGYPSFD